jgi:N-acetylglutamate synthase-like GNAT family acetyltransferase
LPKLYIDEYTKSLAGKFVFIACREGILRDHFSDILADIKFLNRQGIATTLFHNMSNRFSNQKHFKEIAKRLPETKVIRVLPDVDFYNFVLDYPAHVFKIIFLERKYLIDQNGRKINALNTQYARDSISGYGDLIGNLNFKTVLDKICQKIDAGSCERVHILPAGKHSIKRELFTIEGSGTLIANNFEEKFTPVDTEKETDIVTGILNMYKREKYLKPRSKTYIQKHRNDFYVVKIDGIIVGCAEKRELDAATVEIGALAISTKFRNQRVGVYTVDSFIREMTAQGYRRCVSFTNNPKLQKLFRKLGFVRKDLTAFRERRQQSPGVNMYVKEI